MHAISLIQVVLVSLATSSWAITVTQPRQSDTWSSNGPNVVAWTEVNTDAQQVSVLLVSAFVPSRLDPPSFVPV